MQWWDVLSIVLAFLAILWLVKVVAARDRDRDRHEEDDARAFFDRHGRWPDET
jgi:hypothetical protein